MIGADGARSTIAAQLGLDRNRELLTGLEEIVPPISREPVLHCFLDPRLAPGYIAWVANDGHEAHVGVAGNRPGWNAAAALTAFRASLPFPVGRPLERRGGLIPVGGLLRRIACERGLLVGDAAILRQYTGDRFRARFLTRRWMRRALNAAATPALAELAFALLRMPPLRGIAEHVFFARGSFPDAELQLPVASCPLPRG